MTIKKIHIATIEKLLGSITLTMGEDGLSASFFFGRPGARHWEKRLGIEIFYHFPGLDLTALYVRSVGPRYLKALPLEEIRSKLQDFMRENFWYVAGHALGSIDERPFNLWIPEKAKLDLAEALASSYIFNPTNELTVFPLVPVAVERSFASEQFFFSSPKDKDAFSLGDERMQSEYDTQSFPPLVGFKGRKSKPTSWLGVYSPDYRAALKTRSSILGALALTCLPRYRYQFSGRKVFGGRCTVSRHGSTHSFGKEHTPPCMHDIRITDRDAGWMARLSDKLRSTDKEVARELKALEYYYRAWPLSHEERFPVLCMALDAIFGNANNATQAVVEGVRGTLGEGIPEQQIREILSLRASVIHGGAPDVYDSSKYPKYYKKYGCDPIQDLELVVSACLREKVFQGELREHPDPNATIIEKAQAEGRLPPKIHSVSIMNPKI